MKVLYFIPFAIAFAISGLLGTMIWLAISFASYKVVPKYKKTSAKISSLGALYCIGLIAHMAVLILVK